MDKSKEIQIVIDNLPEEPLDPLSSVQDNSSDSKRKSIGKGSNLLGGILSNFLNKSDNINPVKDEENSPMTSSVPEVTLKRPPPLLRGPTMGYMKTVQRRGNIYMIRDSIPSDDDPVESDGVDRMINDLYNETMQMSSSANRRAGIFKYLYVLAAIFITIAGAIIGSLTVQGFSTSITQYAATILGFGIATVQALTSTFSIQSRSVLLKDVSNRLRKVARGLKNLQNSESKPRDKMKRLEEYYAEVDELDLNMFDNTITSVSSPKISAASNDSKRSGSDLSSRSDPLYEEQNTQKDEPPLKNNEEPNILARRFINLLQNRKNNKSNDPPGSSPRSNE